MPIIFSGTGGLALFPLQTIKEKKIKINFKKIKY